MLLRKGPHLVEVAPRRRYRSGRLERRQGRVLGDLQTQVLS